MISRGRASGESLIESKQRCTLVVCTHNTTAELHVPSSPACSLFPEYVPPCLEICHHATRHPAQIWSFIWPTHLHPCAGSPADWEVSCRNDLIQYTTFEGLILTTHHVTICLHPRYPIHMQMQHWQVVPQEPWGLPTQVRMHSPLAIRPTSTRGPPTTFIHELQEVLLSQYLKKLGYRTYSIGKWHLGHFNNASTPLSRGFDYFYGFYSGGIDYLTQISEESCDNAT